MKNCELTTFNNILIPKINQIILIKLSFIS